MLAFYLWGNGNQRIARAAATLVYDPLQRDIESYGEFQQLGTGQCYFCHVTGVMYRRPDTSLAKARGDITNPEAAAFWSDQAEIDPIYFHDALLFHDAIKKVVAGMSDDPQLNRDLMEFKRVEPCYTTTNYWINR